MLKMTGHEFNTLMADKTFWPEGSYYDDCVVTVNGVEMVDMPEGFVNALDAVSISGGMYFGHSGDRTPVPFEARVALWVATRDTTLVLLEVDSVIYDHVMERLENLPGVRIVE